MKKLLFSLALALAAVQAAAAATASPKVTLTAITFKKGTVDLRFRLCLSVGPRAVILTRETRRVGGRVVAANSAVDPLGVDMRDIAPYGCVSNYTSGWIVNRNLIGPGTYTMTLRVRDGYGILSKAVSFSIVNP